MFQCSKCGGADIYIEKRKVYFGEDHTLLIYFKCNECKYAKIYSIGNYENNRK